MLIWQSHRVPLVAIALWLATVIAVAMDGGGHWVYRTALAIMAIILFVRTIRGGTISVLLSPAVALALIVIAFFSLLPALLNTFGPSFYNDATVLRRTGIYVGGRGELIVLQFAAMCMALWSLLIAYFERTPVASISAGRSSHAVVLHGTLSGAVIVSFAVFLICVRTIPTVTVFVKGGIGAEILHSAAPLMSISLAILVFLAARHQETYIKIAVTAGILVFAALITTFAAKGAVFIIVSCIALYVILLRSTIDKILKVAGISVVVLITGVLVLTIIRPHNFKTNPENYTGQLAIALKNAIVSKLIWRQSTTGMCLQNVVDRHFGKPGRQGPLYFAMAPVPRILWPEKPNLSRGTEFAKTYCEVIAPVGTTNDQSITLLGEPLVEAGIVGLVTAQVLLALGLAVITIVCVRAAPAGLVVLAAWLPWLIDFDQHFALYFANAIKMLLFMIPLLVPLFMLICPLPTQAGRSKPSVSSSRSADFEGT